MVTDVGGLGDKSFNDLIYDGLLKAQKELGIEFDYSEPIHAEDYEKSIIEKTLLQVNNNVTKASKILKIPRQTLQRKVKRYKLI